MSDAVVTASAPPLIASPPAPPEPQPPKLWYQSPFFVAGVWVVLVGLLLVCFYDGVFFRDNDFQWHYHVGQHVRRLGQIYFSESVNTPEGPKPFTDYHYPPARIALDAITTFLEPGPGFHGDGPDEIETKVPYRLARGIYFFIAALGFGGSLYLWNDIASKRIKVTPGIPLTTAFFTLIALFPYVLRDFEECGLQMILLALVSLGAWLAQRGKPILAGVSIGAAISYKITPALFVPYLLYKRQWIAALSTVVVTVILNVGLPALFVGVKPAVDANIQYIQWSRSAAKTPDPSRNPVEPASPRNQGLKPAIARYLMTFPPGDDLFLPNPKDVQPDGGVPATARRHPLFFQFGNLDPVTANFVTTALLLLFALVLAVRFFKPWGDAPPSNDMAPEWAAVLVLCALLSPLCWIQHLVCIVPAMFLVVRAAWDQKIPAWRTWGMVVIAAISMLPFREILGKDMAVVWLDYKPHTFSALLIIFMVLTIPDKRESIFEKG